MLFLQLRNQVNRERRACREKYYESKVEHLKDCKPALWWKEVKKLSGMSAADSNQASMLLHIDCGQGEAPVSNTVLANVINKAFLAPMNDFI